MNGPPGVVRFDNGSFEARCGSCSATLSGPVLSADSLGWLRTHSRFNHGTLTLSSATSSENGSRRRAGGGELEPIGTAD